MSTEYEDSITQLFNKFRNGDEGALGALWEVYFQRLFEVARNLMNDMPKRSVDEDDVLISVFAKLCVNKKRFNGIQNRNDLWKLLVTITASKVVDKKRYELRKKRHNGRASVDQSQLAEFETVRSNEPSPHFVSMMRDELESLLRKLDGEWFREIVVYRLEGFEIVEIAKKLGISVRTVQRKLNVIRENW